MVLKLFAATLEGAAADLQGYRETFKYFQLMTLSLCGPSTHPCVDKMMLKTSFSF